jgi:DNA-binding IclR family transcriptional regulator
VEIERLLRRINAVRPNEERMELNALMKIINGIRRDGYMFSKHIIVQDAGVIAVLLPKRDFGCDRALGVGGPVSRIEERHDEILACIRKGIAKFLT